MGKKTSWFNEPKGNQTISTAKAIKKLHKKVQKDLRAVTPKEEENEEYLGWCILWRRGS